MAWSLAFATPCLAQDGMATAGPGLHVEVPPALSSQRATYEATVERAELDVERFFADAGFVLDSARLVDSVRVFEGSSQAREYLAVQFGGKPEDIPETFAGTVVGRTLFLVPETSYEQIWNQLYPAWSWTESTYLQLVTHELAHKAHEDIAKAEKGSADAMGPGWFFEGLAIVCAQQFETNEPLYTPEELQNLVAGKEGLPVSYPLYGRMVRSVLARSHVKSAVLHAADAGFPAPLLSHPADTTAE